MFRKGLSSLLWAFVFISAGGVLLHLRIHPPVAIVDSNAEIDILNLLPVVLGVAAAVILPVMFNASREAAVWGYVMNLLAVALGTVAMAYYSYKNFTGPVTAGSIIIDSTLADILILWAKFTIANSIMYYWRNRPSIPISTPQEY